MDLIKQYDTLLGAALSTGGYVSIPRLQAERGISYHVAREAVLYGIRRGWLEDTPKGFHYHFRVRSLSLRTLSTADCKEMAAGLGRHACRVLTYLGQAGRGTYEDVLREVSDDEEDMREALTELQQKALILCVGGAYCSNLSKAGVDAIKEHWDAAKKSRRSSFFD